MTAPASASVAPARRLVVEGAQCAGKITDLHGVAGQIEIFPDQTDQADAPTGVAAHGIEDGGQLDLPDVVRAP